MCFGFQLTLLSVCFSYIISTKASTGFGCCFLFAAVWFYPCFHCVDSSLIVEASFVSKLRKKWILNIIFLPALYGSANEMQRFKLSFTRCSKLNYIILKKSAFLIISLSFFLLMGKKQETFLVVVLIGFTLWHTKTCKSLYLKRPTMIWFSPISLPLFDQHRPDFSNPIFLSLEDLKYFSWHN